MKKNLIYSLIALSLLTSFGCSKEYLNVLPEDRITTATFWETENDVNLALNGIYSILRQRGVYGSGPTLDACTPDAYQWAHWNGKEKQIGNGSITPGDDGLIIDRWTSCYQIISRSNYFLANYGKVSSLSNDAKATFSGEVHFLRGIAYALLAETYGGVPIINSVIGVDEARKVTRSTREETWNQAIADYDTAIASLQVDAPEVGRATKGAALGLKMRAYLYQNKYAEVLNVINEIEALNKYSLFPSYNGLFQLENENSQEVMFDIQYIGGQLQQGNFFAWLALPQNSSSGASDPAPTQHIVDAYEMVDGSAVDPSNPYQGRDPRLDFTILRPGALFEGKVYPTEIKNHTGQRVGFGLRKNVGENVPITTARMSPLNFIVLRYADVLLAKAEALIETNQNIDEAISLINRIRTERKDVRITLLPTGLSQVVAREKLRHERRIEFFGEGINWADIKRWNIGPAIYPVEVHAADASLIETKFPGGYKEKDNLLPIPDNERAANPNLEQNPGW
ncbi:RagB/SusD family nutrient uptake outer membrane protein [Segetibacter koreensis]|uniref:RagB/SusD family nutrient uptake outer membrane protein n=1 Tax=Segetibacter koreensis TaxID=398037 RepID=UPI000362C63B|nr:RagB/SusD family nutrient uptake outer membrane protein [Segetibacter koreensis]